MTAAARLAAPPGRLHVTWGPGRALTGLALGAGTFIVAGLSGLLLIAAFDLNGTSRDPGGPLHQATEVAAYASAKLTALVEGAAVPAPPDDLTLDLASLRTILGATYGHQVLLAVVAVTLSGAGLAGFWRQTGLRRPPFDGLLRAGMAALVAYLFTALYTASVRQLGIDLLTPEGRIPVGAARDLLTVVMIGGLTVLVAPFAEEMFFRGLIFGGLSQWGFGPAALVTAIAFAAVHLDLGAMIPFTVTGLILCWLCWTSGSVWEPILCHALLNGASFLLLAGAALR